MRQQETKVNVTYTCDLCGHGSEDARYKKDQQWLHINYAECRGMRLFEIPAEYRYESFNIPNKALKDFCSKLCLKKAMADSFDLFVAEVSSAQKTFTPNPDYNPNQKRINIS